MAGKPTLRHRRLARAMTMLREEAGLSTITDAAAASNINKGTISRLESSSIRPSGDTVHALCTAYGADERTTDTLVKLAREVKRGEVGWWQMYGSDLLGRLADLLELESDATTEREFSVDLIPGLLQTEDYARAVIRAGFPSETDEQIQQRVDVRMKRQTRLTELRLNLWVIIDEIAFDRPIGDAKTMAAQLDALVKAAAMPSVTVQVLPKETAGHPALGVPFKLLALGDDEYAYIENLWSGAALEDMAEVKRYQDAWLLLAALALSFDQSAHRIAASADEYRSGAQ